MAKPAKKEIVTSPKGMHDVIGDDVLYLNLVIKEMRRISEYYGFIPIMTPHLEKTELFTRPLGETSDVVEKQMYSLRTRGGDKLSLRPEGSAPVIRAYIEHGMQSMPQPVKLFYAGAFFRHETPQAGRFREFHQAGLEIIGDEDALSDALVIRMFVSALSMLGIRDVIVHVNSLGDKECRPLFRKELVAYYRKHASRLCADCKRRHKENPMRILDCKVEACAALREEAPQMMDHLCDACKKHFSQTLEFLDGIGVQYFLDAHLVRGFDYYSRTVFEIFLESEEAAKIALGGGGRYDGLAELLGAKNIPAVGGGLGVERVASLMKERGIKPRSDAKPKLFVIQLGPAAKRKSIVLLEELRKIGVPVAQTLSKDSLRAQLNIVAKTNIPIAVIIGQKEAIDGTLAVRNMESGMQETIPFEKFIGTIKARLKEFS